MIRLIKTAKWLGVSAFALSYLAPAAPAQDQTEFFEMRIRPILAQECYECHSEATKAKGGLLLDSRAGWQKGGDSGPVIVAGEPDTSLLLQSISHEVSDLEMPKNGAQLDPEVIEDFRKWIAMGAPDPRDTPPTPAELESDTNWEAISARRAQWWSFQPIEKPPVPEIAAAPTAIDSFIQARLKEENLTATEQAEPRVLLRRFFYNLIGLPPSLEETTEFLTAYEIDPKAAVAQLADRLLDDPRFPERWARHWMDWTRYADSHGSEGDSDIPHAWQYRDYLIRALEADVPYDQLVLEHFAGDLLDKPRVNEASGINESAIGPAHLRMVFHGFGPTDALDERVRFTDDQINTVTKAFMGLTVSCARCHDHKFDAISQADYYALFGIFSSTLPATIAIDAPGVLEKNKAALEALKPNIRRSLADYWLSTIPESGDSPETKVEPTPEVAHRWDLSDPAEVDKWTLVGEGLSRADGGEFTIAPAGERIIENILPAGVYSNRLSNRHRGFLASPPFDLDDEYDLYLNVIGDASTARYAVQHYPRKGTVFPITSLDKGTWRWVKHEKLDYWKGDSIHIELATAGETPVHVTSHARSWFGIREAVLVKKGAPFPTDLTTQPTADLARLVRLWREGEALNDRSALALDSAIQSGKLPNQLSTAPAALRALLIKYRDLESSIPLPTRAPGVIERPGIDQALFVRGNHKLPADPVPRRFIEEIDDTPYATEGTGRLEFAHDLLREDNPFTARMIVNRIWGQLFGNGLVSTMDNFGRLGEKPSHPELLDYLATRFREEQQWSIKSLIREIVLSNAWQQASAPSPESTEQDPGNRLLSHYTLRRLDAEAIRDSVLAVSGKLDETRFGPPVTGISNRRSIYLKVKRNQLDPLLTTFDFPTPASTVGRRDATNVPAQSLTLLNDPFIIQQAEEWVKSMPAESEAQQIDQLFKTALTRSPSDDEFTNATRFLQMVESEHTMIQAELKKVESDLTTSRKALTSLLAPVRKKLLDARSLDASGSELVDLKPIAQWDFNGAATDRIGNLNAELHGTARIEDGALILDGGGFASTPALQEDLAEKTLEAFVQLETLDQKGGGVLTVQDRSGTLFDSIVYAERKPKRWLPGSNSHARTRDFNAPDEIEAAQTPVHLAITYQKDGTVRGYRNGKPWGSPINVGKQPTFEAQNAHVVFGLRHGRSTNGNRAIRGRILGAALYNRALEPGEIAASANGDRTFISNREIQEALSDQQSARKAELENAIAALESEASALRKSRSPLPVEKRPLKDLAHAIFNLKEFIFLR